MHALVPLCMIVHVRTRHTHTYLQEMGHRRGSVDQGPESSDGLHWEDDEQDGQGPFVSKKGAAGSSGASEGDSDGTGSTGGPARGARNAKRQSTPNKARFAPEREDGDDNDDGESSSKQLATIFRQRESPPAAAWDGQGQVSAGVGRAQPVGHGDSGGGGGGTSARGVGGVASGVQPSVQSPVSGDVGAKARQSEVGGSERTSLPHMQHRSSTGYSGGGAAAPAPQQGEAAALGVSAGGAAAEIAAGVAAGAVQQAPQARASHARRRSSEVGGGAQVSARSHALTLQRRLEVGDSWIACVVLKEEQACV